MAQLRLQSTRLIRSICPLIRERTVFILASDSLQVILETRPAGQQGKTRANVTVCTNGMLILRPNVSLSQFVPIGFEILLVEGMDDVVMLERPNYMPLPLSNRSENYLSNVSR